MADMNWKDFFWLKLSRNFQVFRQTNQMDCGPTCLQMVANFYGRYYNVEGLRKKCGISNTGVNLLGLKQAAIAIGLDAQGVKVTFDQLMDDLPTPCILFWRQQHFVVLLPSKGTRRKRIKIADPAQGILALTKIEFIEMWSNSTDEDEPSGFALTLEPSKTFFNLKGEKRSIFSWGLIMKYFSYDHSRLFYVFITIVFSIAFQLAVPFLTKELVDKGIMLRDPNFIVLIVLSQFGILLGKMISDFIRSKILLLVSNFINLKMSSDFLRKLMRLPLSYFETRRGGDIFQRLSDNKQIQNFLTGPAVNTTFSILTAATFLFVLLSYDIKFFFIFFIGMCVYFVWITFFFGIKRKINHDINIYATKQNDLSLQIVNGMSEIRIGGGEKNLLNEWDSLQEELFRINSKNLRYSQIQLTGSLFITQGKDLIIILFASNMVIQHQLTLGVLLAIQYIIGALSTPIEQLISFSQSVLDAKQSIARLNDIYQLNNEDAGEINNTLEHDVTRDITISGLTFAYPGAGSKAILRNLNLIIPEGKITAIVGLSGSGKTTLIKLILRFYEDYQGTISVAGRDLKNINIKDWRKRCGAVLQDGYIFNDSIEKNISIGDDYTNEEKLLDACRAANILEFITSLPNGFKTKVGVEGVNVSQGQKQRILIARALYKNPSFLFLDEATNSLDAENEKIIVNNLNELFKGKTVLIIAHRLSTVKDADNIIVLGGGEIKEEGTHEELISRNGRYFHLVKNQLELGM